MVIELDFEGRVNAFSSPCPEFSAVTQENVNIEACRVGRRQSPLNNPRTVVSLIPQVSLLAGGQSGSEPGVPQHLDILRALAQMASVGEFDIY